MIGDCCLILITIIFPPIGVMLAYGCGAQLCINIILTLMGYLPGILHGLYVIMKRPRYFQGNLPGHYQQNPPQFYYSPTHQGPYQQGPPHYGLPHQGPPPPPHHHRAT